MSKLLVIDDCEIQHFIIDKMLGREEIFEEREASFDAELAINQLENDRLDEDKLPDVIFLDLVMPGFTGFDFLERFKNLQRSIQKNIHVFILTCSLNPADKKNSEQYPFVKGFIVKPVSMHTLKNIALAYSGSMELL